MAKTIAELYAFGKTALVEHSGNPEADARHLLMHITDLSHSQLITDAHKGVKGEIAQIFFTAIETLQSGWPLAYILGEEEFYGRTFTVTEDVLIPRPETELIVEHSLKAIENIPQATVLELGTGSGAIAITLAKERSDLTVFACELSTKALSVAQQNQLRLGSDVKFLQGNWLSTIAPHSLDMIVSNPPYIAQNDPHLKGAICHEPQQALISGTDGLDDIRHIVQRSREALKPNGYLLFEHGYDQGPAIAELLQEYGYQNICQYRDYGGHVRFSGGRCPSAKLKKS